MESSTKSNSRTTVLTIPASKNTADAIYTCMVLLNLQHDGQLTQQDTEVKSNVFSEYANNFEKIPELRRNNKLSQWRIGLRYLLLAKPGSHINLFHFISFTIMKIQLSVQSIWEQLEIRLWR